MWEFVCGNGSGISQNPGNGHSGPLSRMDKAFGHQETKDCLVVLNRLDEKLLKRYLRRKKDAKRRRTKVKPLCYTDDEDDPVEAKPLKNCSENDESAQIHSREMKNAKQESKEVGCEVEQTKEELKEETKMESSSSPFGHCSAGDNKVQKIITKEFPRSFPGNVTSDKAICDEKFIAQEDSVNDFDDSRDDGEDDRSTVIFEKDGYLEEFFELEEKEKSNNLRKKKITNRKRQRLVKFKRKSMNGRNLGKIRKSKSKLFESGSGGLGATEKSVSDCIPEDSLREVCISVRRLHEMYTIILQLQKEMPKDTELSYHFKRVINAQLENFHEEIRKRQKIIIKSFEKMLKPSNNTLDKVASDIGNRTFLTSEDVIYVLSLCILSEGSYDVDKSGSLEKTQQPKSSPGSLRKLGTTKKAAQGKSYKSQVQHKEAVNTEVPSAAPASRTPIPPVPVSGHQVEQAPVAFVPNTTVQTFRACPQPFNYYQPTYQRTLVPTYQRSHFWAQQNYESAHINNSGVRQFREVNPPQVVRQSVPSTHLPSTRSHYYNIPYTSQNALYPVGPRPPSNCTIYSLLGHHQRGGNLFPVQGPPIHLPSQTQYNHVPDKPNANQTFGSPVLEPNTIGCGVLPNRIPGNDQPVTVNSAPRITQERGNFPNLENFSCNVGNGEIIPSPESNSQCHLNLTHSVGCYNSAAEKPVHERVTVLAEAGYSSTETNSISNTVSEVLDPTIPQRLTMKDSRLQAIPILDSSKSSEEEEEEDTECSAVESPNQELSRYRTYTCAEDGCKNPGVLICNFCRSVIYCSKTCQEKHWDLKHKEECCQLKELRV